MSKKIKNTVIMLCIILVSGAVIAGIVLNADGIFSQSAGEKAAENTVNGGVLSESESESEDERGGGNTLSEEADEDMKDPSLTGAQVARSFIDKTLSPAELALSDAKNVNPLAFYVGKVQRKFGDETKLDTVNLSDYITESSVKSVNEDLTLDYENGYLLINTDKAQGIVGFTENAPKDFKDVTIKCENEYASIVVISLDNKDIKSSERLLIQLMTEEMPLGYKTEIVTEAKTSGSSEIVDKKQIVDIGGGMMQVKRIENAVVSLKGVEEGYVAVLDENGYVRDFIQPSVTASGLEIAVPSDAMYIVYSKTPLSKPDLKNDDSAGYIWWEGENYSETSFPDPYSHSYFDARTASGTDDFSILSGGEWLSISSSLALDTPAFVKYNIEVPEDAEFTLYTRKFWKHGPFRWRFDGGEWTECGEDITLLDSIDIRTHLCANWVYLGDVNLTAGTHVFEIELLQVPGRINAEKNSVEYTAGFDCFILTKEPFIAAGKIKPDENKPDPDNGYFAFDPAYDNFIGAELDLRGLNEEIAGKDGFIKTDGENLVFPNGDKMRFWGVNTGHDTLNASNSSIDYMAKSLAKRGVNLIRIHGAAFEIKDRKAYVDTQKLDRLSYFIYAMKNAGIYVNISIYFPLWYDFGADEGYPEYEEINNKHPFMLLQFEQDFQKVYKDAVKQMFEYVSPYTNVALKDEPAIAFFEIQNEDNYFFWTFKPSNIPSVYLNILEKMFGDWLTEKYGSIDAAFKSWGNTKDSRDDFENGIVGLKDAWSMTRDGATNSIKKRMSDQVEFLAHNQKSFYADIADYLKNDIKTQTLVIAGNWATADPGNLEAIERYTYSAGDVIDRHGYFEPEIHQGDGRQSYSVNPGDKYLDTTGLTIPDKIPVKYAQNYNMPYMDSEINWPNPNRFRAEFPMLLSAYSSLAGVDAPISFALGTSFEKIMTKFAIYTPAIVGQFPAAALIYRNGYVRETEPVVLETLNVEDLYKFSGSFVNEDVNLDMFRQQ